ncbi:MAG: hypothetical protein K0U89_14475, partial [Planctomycetes bacterium]|nr:hypothetical protein [Planctomycetota bacterium]
HEEMTCTRIDLCRNPLVQLDQPTEMFFAVDLTELDCLVFRGGSTEQGGRCSRELCARCLL